MKSSFIFTSFVLVVIAAFLASCKADDPAAELTPPHAPQLIFKFRFDSTQVRLNNFGVAEDVAGGNAAQSPDFNGISAHYIELSPSAMTALGAGNIVYEGEQTNAGGAAAIDFDQATIVGQDEVFKSYKLADLTPGSYNFIRVSLSYQNYDIQFRALGLNWNATLASFIGFNNYISSYTINTQEQVVDDDKLQGYWGLEADIMGSPYVVTGQAPPGATTVPNPLFSTSPIPAGSCVVTGQFASPLVITGSETEDIVVVLSLSNNHSFEWTEVTADGLYEPEIGENVVDMGIRGLIPIIE
ncbi:MAG: hypothetical protein ACKVOK_13840 [Flavobacteriales bacterium]